MLLSILLLICPHQQIFLESYVPVAKEIEAEHGIPAELILAQCAQETGWGRYYRGNNLFGITAGSDWSGETFFADDDGNEREFRSYENTEDSFRDYAKLLKSKYIAQCTDTTCPYALISCLAGYAEDKDYEASLRWMVKFFDHHLNSPK